MHSRSQSTDVRFWRPTFSEPSTLILRRQQGCHRKYGNASRMEKTLYCFQTYVAPGTSMGYTITRCMRYIHIHTYTAFEIVHTWHFDFSCCRYACRNVVLGKKWCNGDIAVVFWNLPMSGLDRFWGVGTNGELRIAGDSSYTRVPLRTWLGHIGQRL